MPKRKNKEKQAKKEFDSQKKLTLSMISMQTGLAVISALAQPNANWVFKAANAAADAATGAASYAKAASQSYSAPSAPSGSNIGTQNNNNSSNQTNVTINVSQGNATGQEVVNAVKAYVGSGGILINQDDEQASVLIG